MLLDATLTPLGGVFNQGLEGGAQNVVQREHSQRSDTLGVRLEWNDVARLGESHRRGRHRMAHQYNLTSIGKYFARVTGANDNVQLYQLKLTAAALSTTLLGDYNSDGVVDAADYTVWRDLLGQRGSNLAADGDNNGRVDAADYGLWKSHFGMSTGSGSSDIVVGSTVPEPATLVAFLAALGVASSGSASARQTLRDNRPMRFSLPELNANRPPFVEWVTQAVPEQTPNSLRLDRHVQIAGRDRDVGVSRRVPHLGGRTVIMPPIRCGAQSVKW